MPTVCYTYYTVKKKEYLLELFDERQLPSPQCTTELLLLSSHKRRPRNSGRRRARIVLHKTGAVRIVIPRDYTTRVAASFTHASERERHSDLMLIRQMEFAGFMEISLAADAA